MHGSAKTLLWADNEESWNKAKPAEMCLGLRE